MFSPMTQWVVAISGWVMLWWATCLFQVPYSWGATSNSSSDAVARTEREALLSLADAVLLALENNLDITVSRQTRDVRVTDILFEQAKFDPTINVSGRFDRTITPLNRPIFGFSGVQSGDEPDNIAQVDTSASIGITQKLLTGTDYEVTLDSSRNSVAGDPGFLFNPSHITNLVMNLTQPLLRDFGPDVNQTQIKVAQNAAKVEQYVFLDQVLSVIVNVEQAYWELVFAKENLKVAEAALQAAEALLNSNRAKVKAGVMAQVEVLQAEAAVASRIGQVLIAENTIRDQVGQLRLLFNPPEDKLREDWLIIPTDQPIQQREPLSLRDAIDAALGRRPEILQAKRNIETSHLNVKFAKNQLLPSLAFQGTIGINGLGKDVADAADRTVAGDFFNAGAGLVLSYPLGNRSASSQYNRRQLEVLRAQASLRSVRQGVIVNTKEAFRQVQTDFRRIRTTGTARELAEKQLEAEQERLNVGLSTTRIVLDFQRDLAVSRGNEIRTIVDYNKSLANLRRTTATTLDRYQIVLQ